jgi:hypothetical protein
MDIVRRVEALETGEADKPLLDVVIADCGQIVDAPAAAE